MAKRITDTQRIINFSMGADEAALNQAIESLQAIRSNRFPSKPARKQRADAGKSRRTPPSTPPAAPVGEPSSSEN